MSLRQLLRTHLAPYRRVLWLVVVLQGIQTGDTLALPTRLALPAEGRSPGAATG